MAVESTVNSISRLQTAEVPRVRFQRRRDIDWPVIEQDYRAGLLSLRELALKHGCSHSAIANFAGRHGWPRKRTPEP
jgi:hypothetical protein